MKKEEIVAEEYLKTKFSKIIFEPIKGQTPDFLCDDKIAVEVRLLNQNYETSDGYEGLLGTEITIQRTLEKIYSEYVVSNPSQNWYVHHEFFRPVPTKKETVEFTRAHLEKFKNSLHKEEDHSFNKGNLKITFSPKTTSLETEMFTQGGWIDHDSGGFIQSELLRNLNIAIKEKAQKVQKNYHQFNSWWLILIDEINDAHSNLYTELIPLIDSSSKAFLKIILISKCATRSVEIISG